MSRPTRKRLLIVEDHAQLRSILAAALYREGFAVRTAESVAGGQAAVNQEPLDAAVIDIELPDGSGWDLIRLTRLKHGAAVHIIAISANHPLYPPNADAMPDAMLAKPFAIDALITQLGHQSQPTDGTVERLTG